MGLIDGTSLNWQNVDGVRRSQVYLKMFLILVATTVQWIVRRRGFVGPKFQWPDPTLPIILKLKTVH